MPGVSGELARGEIKAVGIVLQLCCLVAPTLVLVLVLCFWVSGLLVSALCPQSGHEVGRFATGSFTFQFTFFVAGSCANAKLRRFSSAKFVKDGFCI